MPALAAAAAKAVVSRLAQAVAGAAEKADFDLFIPFNLPLCNMPGGDIFVPYLIGRDVV